MLVYTRLTLSEEIDPCRVGFGELFSTEIRGDFAHVFVTTDEK